MSILVIIPARMASARLPGKPLADLGGKPMVVRVAEAAARAGFGAPLIAADGPAIADAVRQQGFEAVLTSPDLPSGSDRVLAAARQADPAGAADIIVNVQGDMPELPPGHVRAAVAALRGNPGADMATLAFASTDEAQARDASVVKVIMDEPAGQAVPTRDFNRRDAAPPFWHHIGLYAWRRAALERFCALPPSPRERAEKLEQLRALEAGMMIVCAPVRSDCPGIDTPADLARIQAKWPEGA